MSNPNNVAFRKGAICGFIGGVLAAVLGGVLILSIEYHSGWFMRGPTYVVAKSYWLSKEPTLLFTYSPRSERAADVIAGTEVRILRRQKASFYAFGEDNPLDLLYVEIVNGLDQGTRGYIPENMVELKK